jgi:hypothetical protein
MPYNPSMAGSDEPASDQAPTDPSEPANPFLQFVDPLTYRQMVARALSSTEAGRLITPLSRIQHVKSDSAALGNAWDAELADDAV